MNRTYAVTAVGFLALVLGVGCADGSAQVGEDPRPTPSTTSTPATTPATTPSSTTPEATPGATGTAPGPADTEPATPVVVDTVASGLTSPWGLAFLPDGTALVSERDTARILHIGKDGDVTEAGTVPGVVPTSEGGLLGIAVGPAFDEEPLVYAYFSSAEDNRIATLRYADGELGDARVIVDGIPMSFIHNGGRIAFGPDGMLYVGTGDGNEQSQAQDPESLAGKILRYTPKGEPAPGNPTEGSPVWSLGHRNVQGLAFAGDRLWASEFGQDTWDELNLITAGANYGWLEVEGRSDGSEFVDPVAQWRPAQASPSGIEYAEGAVWMACLRGERLWRIRVRDGAVVGEPRPFFTGEYGRLRTVALAPDGSLWLMTSNTDGRGDPAENDDRILRVELR